MENKHYFYKLLAPRPTFHLDMSAREQEVMNNHMTYWKELFDKGVVIVYGPVFDTTGVYGMAVIETDDDPELLMKNDPAVLSGVCMYDLFPMQVGMVR